MHSETPGVKELQDEAQEADFQGAMVYCPGCKENVPNSIYCLKCGYPLHHVDHVEGEHDASVEPHGEDLPEIDSMDAPSEQLGAPVQAEEMDVGVGAIGPGLDAHERTEGSAVEEELGHHELVEEPSRAGFERVEVDDVEIDVDEGPAEPVEGAADEEDRAWKAPEPSYPPEKASGTPWDIPTDLPTLDETVAQEADFEPDPAIVTLTKDLMNSISLTLWSVDLLLEGSVEEDHFNNIFEGYEARSRSCMARRRKMLEHAQDLDLLEKSLTEAKVGLWELEVRNTIGDLHEGEYEAKAPSYSWEIRHSQEEIARRRGEIGFLEDPTKVLPAEKILGMKETCERAFEKIEGLQNSGGVGSETASMVKAFLEDTLEFLKDIK
jgi:hypothetical protein